MKTLFTFLMPVLVIAAGVASLISFNNGYYILSAVLTLSSYLSASLWIYILKSRRVAIG